MESKFALLAILLVTITTVLSVTLADLLSSATGGLFISLAIMVPISLYVVHHFLGPINRLIGALGDGVASFKDGDFSISLNAGRNDELGELVRHYNSAGEILRNERFNLYQRELLLDTVIQNMPWALVLVNANERVIYSNAAARQLFDTGHNFEGRGFAEVLKQSPDSLREAVESGRDGMFSLRHAAEDEIYYLYRENFTLNSQHHSLYLFKQLTRELNRQEVAIWKKVIRVISHELNNSLAPISSLAHSGGILARELGTARLETVFATIEERATHLKIFIDGYGQFAKLPVPHIVRVDWKPFIASLHELALFTLAGSLPQQAARFDPVQLQQVLINLFKNAHESGSPTAGVTLTVRQGPQGVYLEVTDAGPGMVPEVLEQALLPFYSTKQAGTGLGLALCREIVEAHNGRLTITNHPQGGLTVSVWLPASLGR
ncbi:MAG: sensor histidine kinase [Gammaproteobacteria bacterium]